MLHSGTQSSKQTNEKNDSARCYRISADFCNWSSFVVALSVLFFLFFHSVAKSLFCVLHQIATLYLVLNHPSVLGCFSKFFHSDKIQKCIAYISINNIFVLELFSFVSTLSLAATTTSDGLFHFCTCSLRNSVLEKEFPFPHMHVYDGSIWMYTILSILFNIIMAHFSKWNWRCSQSMLIAVELQCAVCT